MATENCDVQNVESNAEVLSEKSTSSRRKRVKLSSEITRESDRIKNRTAKLRREECAENTVICVLHVVTYR